MTAANEARERILGRIRRGLRRGPLSEGVAETVLGRLRQPPRNLIPARATGRRAELVARFVANVEKEFGTVARTADAADIPTLVADWLAAHNLPAELRAAPDPELEALPWSSCPVLTVRFGRAEPSDMATLTPCFAGIAETGTLLFASGPTHPTTLNLLPEAHLVLLRESRIVGAFEEAWDLLRAERGAPADLPAGRRFMPRNVMLVTGPSRSADIEQTLELGAHGPKSLHVILLEDCQD